MGCSSWNIHSQKESLSFKKNILLKWISVVQRRIWSRLADNRCDRHWFMSDHNQSTNFPIPFGRGVGGGVGWFEILSFFISHARDWWPTLWGSKQQQQTSGGKTKMVKRRWRKKIKKKKRGRGGGGGGGGGRGEKKSLKEDDENKCFASL